MGYPDDDTFAEAHGWNKDRPSFSEIQKAGKPVEMAPGMLVSAPKLENAEPPKADDPAAKYGIKIVSHPIINEIVMELERATVKFPTWPTDPLHALGVLHEEVGELSKEVLQLVYEPHKSNKEEVRKEAIQAAAMAIRFAMSLDSYKYNPGSMHKQKEV